MKFVIFLKGTPLFTLSVVICICKKNPFGLNKLKTKKNMNLNFSGFVINVEAIICLLLHILHDCNFMTFA